MIKLRPRVLLLHGSAPLVTSIGDAIGDRSRVLVAEGWEQLEAGVGRLAPGAVIVVDPFRDSESEGPSRRLRQLLTTFPSALVLAAFPVTATSVMHLATLVGWGVADVIDEGREDTPSWLRRRIELARARRVGRLLERAAPRSTGTRAQPLLVRAAEVAAAGGGSGELAEALGATERTVLRWFRSAELPDPRRLLTWFRVLLAAELIDDPGRTLGQVALACGYSSDASLRNAFRSLLGVPPTAVRGRAFASATEAFARELFQHREAARENGRPERVWLN
jgi:AraC-like DNA-binding protein